jgi:hypothetical protein
LVEQLAVNQLVRGSSPRGGANKIRESIRAPDFFAREGENLKGGLRREDCSPLSAYLHQGTEGKGILRENHQGCPLRSEWTAALAKESDTTGSSEAESSRGNI